MSTCTETLSWSVLQLTSKGPGARTGHTATHVTLHNGEDALLIFGGKRALGDYVQDPYVVNVSSGRSVPVNIYAVLQVPTVHLTFKPNVTI